MSENKEAIEMLKKFKEIRKHHFVQKIYQIKDLSGACWSQIKWVKCLTGHNIGWQRLLSRWKVGCGRSLRPGGGRLRWR